MFKRFVLVCFVFFAASPALAGWEPPAGMIWQTRNGLCQPTDADVNGCPYGPAGTKDRVAYAYFRVCGFVFEARPFLIVDLAGRNFIFDTGDGAPAQVSPLAQDGVPYTHMDVLNFFRRMQAKRGPCPKEIAI